MFRFYSKHGVSNRITVVGQHSEGVLELAASRCSNRDNFSRKVGRAIAEGRLRSGKLVSSIEMEECSTNDFVAVAKQVEAILVDSPNIVQIDFSANVEELQG